MCTGDFHSIFYRQERIGYHGKVFKLYKYRTMCINADEKLSEILQNNKELADEYRINKKLKKDPRVTKAGKYLRKLSIDEFPQFINVFIGNMSLIGNRPYLPKERDDMGKYYEDIVKTKPGITGYWQVSGRNNVTFAKRLKLEQYYSDNCCIILDIRILFHTVRAVLLGDGAL